MILAIKTDNPKAELYLLKNKIKVGEIIWQADRRLADELLPKIESLLVTNTYSINDLTGILVFTGDGSFTGLRIGTSIANAIAYSENIPIVEAKGKDWIEYGQEQLAVARAGNYVVPKYSSEPNITKPRHT